MASPGHDLPLESASGTTCPQRIQKWRQNIDMMDEKNYDKLWKFILKFTDFVEESVSAGTGRLLLIPYQIESFTVQGRIF